MGQSRVHVQGMRKEEPDMEVRLAATQALTNALEFASTNFSNETERNYLMQARALRVPTFHCLYPCTPNRSSASHC